MQRAEESSENKHEKLSEMKKREEQRK